MNRVPDIAKLVSVIGLETGIEPRPLLFASEEGGLTVLDVKRVSRVVDLSE